MLIVNKLDQFLRHASPQLNYSINAADYVYSSCSGILCMQKCVIKNIYHYIYNRLWTVKGTRLQNKDILLDTFQTSSLDNMLIEGCIQKVKKFSAMQWNLSIKWKCRIIKF